MNLEGLIRSKLENVRPVAGGGWQCACPICRLEGSDSQSAHLRVYVTGAFSCVKHQSDFTHNRLIRAYLYKDATPEALALLETSFIDPDPQIQADKVYPEELLLKLIPDHSYWVNRGIDEEILRKLGGGVAPLGERSKLMGRYVHAIRNKNNRIIGFAGRLIAENSFGPKWKIIGKKTRFIYPDYSILSQELSIKREIILVESIGCVLSLASSGIWNTFCLFGLNPSSLLLNILVSSGISRIIIATNNESSGIGNLAAQKIKTQLSPFFNEDKIVIGLPFKKDFAEMHKDECLKWYDEYRNK